jgi:hypothetical protein
MVDDNGGMEGGREGEEGGDLGEVEVQSLEKHESDGHAKTASFCVHGPADGIVHLRRRGRERRREGWGGTPPKSFSF